MMKLAWALGLAMCGTMQAEPPGQLSAAERKRAAAELEASRKQFLAEIDGLTVAQWTFKPGPDRWSVAECAEHIAATEDTYFALIERLLRATATPEKKKEAAGKDDYVLKEMQNRDNKRTAGETLQPSGRWRTREELTAHFNRSRDRLIEFVRTTGLDLRGHHQAHRAVGLIDAYQWILLASGHSRRHTMQIEEVKASAGYPRR